MTIQEVNKKLKTEFRWFSGFSWKNNYEFYITNETKTYLFNVKTKEGKLVTALSDKAENTKRFDVAGSVAYTIDNNLYAQSADGMKLKITDNSDKNIVSGQAIARSEFGITEGIFWSPNGQMIAFYQKDESNVHDYPLLDNSAYPGSLRNIKYPMAGQGSEKSAVGIYNTSTKTTVFIKPQGQ